MQPRLAFVKQPRRIEQCVLVRGRTFDESAPRKSAPQATVRGAGTSGVLQGERHEIADPWRRAHQRLGDGVRTSELHRGSCEEKRTCGGSPAPREADAGSGGELTLLPRSTGGRAGGTGFGLGGGPAATGGATSQGGWAGSEGEPVATGGETAAGGETASGGAGDGEEPSGSGAGANGSAPTACEPNPCAHGACSPLGASFECECDAGYDGDLCEKNIDDCTPNPCRNGGRCDDGVGAYSCVCDGRFTGDEL